MAPAQLPYDVPDFVGRDLELAVLNGELLNGELSSGPTRMRILTGTAGVGKTALVVHWAHRTRPDGQLYVDLRGYGPGEPAAPADAQRFTLCTMGDLHRDSGHSRLAIDCYDQALEISRTHGDRWQAAMLLTRLAELHSRDEQLTRAAEHLRDALDLLTEMGDDDAVADIRARLAALPA